MPLVSATASPAPPRNYNSHVPVRHRPGAVAGGQTVQRHRDPDDRLHAGSRQERHLQPGYELSSVSRPSSGPVVTLHTLGELSCPSMEQFYARRARGRQPTISWCSGRSGGEGTAIWAAEVSTAFGDLVNWVVNGVETAGRRHPRSGARLRHPISDASSRRRTRSSRPVVDRRRLRGGHALESRARPRPSSASSVPALHDASGRPPQNFSCAPPPPNRPPSAVKPGSCAGVAAGGVKAVTPARAGAPAAGARPRTADRR